MRSTKTASLEEIRKMHAKGEVTAPSPSTSTQDMPENFWDDAEVVDRTTKKSVHLRVDPEVFEYFKAGGKGHLTRMNNVLRAYVEAKSKGLDPVALKQARLKYSLKKKGALSPTKDATQPKTHHSKAE